MTKTLVLARMLHARHSRMSFVSSLYSTDPQLLLGRQNDKQ